MTTWVHLAAEHQENAKVKLTCSVIPRKGDWLVRLLEKCPGPKAMARSLPDVQEGEVCLDQKGRLVEYPAGAWRVAVPSSRIDCPKTLTKVEATAERSVEGAARTTVWIEKELKMNGDSLNCTDELAKLLRLGPGQALDRAVGLTGAKPRNEAFLKEQDACCRSKVAARSVRKPQGLEPHAVQRRRHCRGRQRSPG
ncbi:unnamed protein product [Effrenium voratum]|nr:unnamed protein product [Effrenium voratum]